MLYYAMYGKSILKVLISPYDDLLSFNYILLYILMINA